jgi:small subunit ribosomal protein S17
MSGQRRSMVGTVVSNKMDKTVVVTVERLGRHPLYKKVVKSRKKFKAHDADNACQIGDVVRISESRPLSKEKRWVVEEIVRAGQRG